MKTKFSPIFMLTWAVVLTGLWIAQPMESGSRILEYIFVGIIIIFFMIGIYLNYLRFKRKKQGFPEEDELSRKLQQKASSLSYFSSIFLWLFLIFIYYKLAIDINWILSIGMMGMATIYIIAWFSLNYTGYSDEK